MQSTRSTLIRRSVAVVVLATLVVGCGSTSPGLEATQSEDAPANVGPDPGSTVPPATDTPATDTPETDTPTTETPETDTPSTETPETDTPATDTPATDPGMMDLPDNTVPLDGPFPFDGKKEPQVFDGLMVATVNDLVAWWGAEMPRVFGQEYTQLAGGVFPAYPQRTEYPSPGCFSTYEDIAGNGFYCPRGDYIVWDDTNYALPNYEDHGSGAITGLMSHEWGHAIQARTGVFDANPEPPTVIVELQADCYSGAWFAHIGRGESEALTFTDADIRSGLIDTVLSADPVGTTPDIEGAHGAGFDRVAAFQDGFDAGSEKCSTYIATPPPITEIGFTDDELNNDDPGDLSYDDLITLIPQDLDQFWQATLPDDFTALTLEPFSGDPPTCGTVDMAVNTNPLALYCPDNSTVYLDEAGARATLDQYGDFSPSYLMATAWAEAAQTAVGSQYTGEDRVLYNDCFVGVWAGQLPTAFTDDRDLAISPGDLDEAVATTILLADDTSDENVRGDSFAKVEAFRIGVLQGIPGCNELFS